MKLVRYLAVGALLLLLLAVARGASLSSAQIDVAAAADFPLDEDGIVRRFSEGLRFPTISHSDRTNFDADTFDDYREFLAESYPSVHAALELEIVAGHTLLYTWPGAQPELDPVVLMAHYDVVPADDLEQWEQAPWGGARVDGYVWGRGAIDDKNDVHTTLEAVAVLLEEGFAPERSVILTFGHDEEVGGLEGARAVAQRLDERGLRPFLVLDEGGAAAVGLVPFIDEPVALVGVAEKGSANVRMIARHTGPQHSSMPPPKTPVGRLSTAIHRLEANQRIPRITPAVESLFDALGPEMPLAGRAVLANRDLLAPLFRRLLLTRPETAALLRTTTAATMMRGSSKENIVPAEAEAVVNFRILPGETVESTVEHVRATIADDTIEISTFRSRQPSTESRTDTAGWNAVATTIRETIPDAIVVPWLVTGGTDARYYHPISDSVYRFSPNLLTPGDLRGAHGLNERVSVENLLRSVRFYARLIRRAAGPEA